MHLHPAVYGEMLAEKMQKHKSNAWLINTGWSGGKYGIGKRMNLKITRSILDAIHNGSLDNVSTTPSPIFGFNVPDSCPGVDSEILNPKNTWADKVIKNFLILNFLKLIFYYRVIMISI